MTRSSSSNWLKLKFKRLIEACGGLQEASEACKETTRPYSVQQLSRCQNPNAPDHAPLDIIEALEAYCGQPLVSRALVDKRPWTRDLGDVRDEASDVTEHAAHLQRRIREALTSGGEIDRAEALSILSDVEKTLEHVQDVKAFLTGIATGGGRGASE